jgi:hypothetical protein
MTEVLVALRIIRHNWKLVLGGLLLLAVSLWGAAGHMGKRQALKKLQQAERSIDAMKLASARAEAEHLAAARAREASYLKAQKEHSDAYETRLAAARDQLARFVRTQAAARDAERRNLSGTAAAAPTTAGAGGEAFVPVADLTICAENTIRAEAWRDWFLSVSEPSE